MSPLVNEDSSLRGVWSDPSENLTFCNTFCIWSTLVNFRCIAYSVVLQIAPVHFNFESQSCFKPGIPKLWYTRHLENDLNRWFKQNVQPWHGPNKHQIHFRLIHKTILSLPVLHSLLSSYFSNKVMPHIKKIDFFFPEYPPSSDEYSCDPRKKKTWFLVFKDCIAVYTDNSRVFQLPNNWLPNLNITMQRFSFFNHLIGFDVSPSTVTTRKEIIRVVLPATVLSSVVAETYACCHAIGLFKIRRHWN